MAFLIKNYLFKNKKYTVIKTKNLVPWNIYFNRFFIILQVKIFKKYKKFEIINFLNINNLHTKTIVISNNKTII